jgi:Ca-activated chloride channel homolog
LQDLIDVLNSPNGWCDYGIPDCRRAVFYGHTDPNISSTGLSTTIAEYYACARENRFDERQLSLTAVTSPNVRDCVIIRAGQKTFWNISAEEQNIWISWLSRKPT